MNRRPSTEPSPSPALNPGDVAALAEEVRQLALETGAYLDGSIVGRHRSRRRGTSTEFSEHRPYWPGDELKRLDWRILGRTDRLYIKQYDDETNILVQLIVDKSGSMKVGAPVTKAQRADLLAGALTHLAVQQGDSVGLTIVNGESNPHLSAQSTPKHAAALVETLGHNPPSARPADMVEFLRTFAGRHRRRALIVLFSDFLDVDASYIAMLKRLTTARNEVVAMHLIAPEEMNLPFDAGVNFEDLEGPNTLYAHPRQIRRAYLDELSKFHEQLRRDLLQAGVTQFVHSIDARPADVLRQFLSRHSRPLVR